MKNEIKNLISIAENTDDVDTQFNILHGVSDILTKLATTINCPSDWRSIGEELAEEYKDDKLIYCCLELWDYEEQ